MELVQTSLSHHPWERMCMIALIGSLGSQLLYPSFHHHADHTCPISTETSVFLRDCVPVQPPSTPHLQYCTLSARKHRLCSLSNHIWKRAGYVWTQEQVLRRWLSGESDIEWALEVANSLSGSHHEEEEWRSKAASSLCGFLESREQREDWGSVMTLKILPQWPKFYSASQGDPIPSATLFLSRFSELSKAETPPGTRYSTHEFTGTFHTLSTTEMKGFHLSPW